MLSRNSEKCQHKYHIDTISCLAFVIFQSNSLKYNGNEKELTYMNRILLFHVVRFQKYMHYILLNCGQTI